MIYYGLATIAGLLFARKSRLLPGLKSQDLAWPSMALLKPLHGWDENLGANLRSFMEVDYPRKEYIFGVTTPTDPALEAMNKIVAGYPGARVTQTVGDEPSSNRKVGKLLRMLRQPPSSEILVMSDADVRVDRDYLRRIAGEMEQNANVGLVTCLYKGVAPQGGLGARLESSFINTDFVPTALLSNWFGPMRHAFASTVAMRQSTLREAGGLDSVKNCYGDDFALARRVAAAGYEIRLSSSVVTMTAEKMSFRDFWDHQMRWAMVDRKIRPVSQFRMLINGPFWALALLIASGLAWPWTSAALATLAARWAMAGLTLRRVLRLPLGFADLALLPVKDVLMQAVWMRSLAGDTVEWRGRKLRLLATGEMEET